METKKILVIDDEKIVLDSVVKILSEGAYTVDTTQSSKEGLRKGLTGSYDCILTDIRMPEIGGMKVLREIKREKPSVPVIIITGYATVESAVQAMKLGAAEYIEKPFTPDLLLSKVEKTLSNAKEIEPESPELIHKEEIVKVLERAARDHAFVGEIFYKGADALSEYTLTNHEKLALLTGDIQWIESYIGTLTKDQRRWLEQRLSAEIW